MWCSFSGWLSSQPCKTNGGYICFWMFLLVHSYTSTATNICTAEYHSILLLLVIYVYISLYLSISTLNHSSIPSNSIKAYLVGGLVAIFLFSQKYWEFPSSQLTFIFSEGWPNHQPAFLAVDQKGCSQLQPSLVMSQSTWILWLRWPRPIKSRWWHGKLKPWLFRWGPISLRRGYRYLSNLVFPSLLSVTDHDQTPMFSDILSFEHECVCSEALRAPSILTQSQLANIWYEKCMGFMYPLVIKHGKLEGLPFIPDFAS